MIKALFFDIDGTLVSFETHHVPHSAVEAIAAAKAKGVKVFIATGRPRQFINGIDEIQPYVDGYMTVNGAYCYIGGRDVRLAQIPHDSAEAMIAMSDEMSFGCIVMGLDGVAVHNHTKEMDDIVEGQLNIDYKRVLIPLSEVMTQPIVQITPFFDVDTEKKVMSHIDGCQAARWYPAFCDVTSSQADKGLGLKDMARSEGFDICETMAFGDGGNDVTMLKSAGTGVAMGNARDEVKTAADYVTSTVDDGGVALALRKFVL